MISNISKFEKDLENLITTGELLHNAMIYEEFGIKSFKNSKGQIDKDIEEFVKKLPKFSSKYDTWYSESLVLIKQLIPDRLNNFIGFYEKPKGRKDISYANYVVQDYLQGLRVTRGGSVVVSTDAAIPQFQQQLAIVKSAKQRFKSSLFDIKQLVQADLFDSEVDSARELLKNKFLRPAGVICGVVLEKHLQQVCESHNVTINSKNPTIAVLNEALKASSVIDQAQWRYITLLGDYRNICGHNDKKKGDPTEDQVRELIDGTDKILKTIF